MITWVLMNAGYDPSYAVGNIMINTSKNEVMAIIILASQLFVGMGSIVVSYTYFCCVVNCM